MSAGPAERAMAEHLASSVLAVTRALGPIRGARLLASVIGLLLEEVFEVVLSRLPGDKP